jgi:hypothetical protein
MGTRHLIAVVLDGEYRIAQYGQWDGYPSGQGVSVLAFLRGMDRQRFEANLRASSFMSEADLAALKADITKRGLEDRWQKKWPHLSRDAGADVLRMVMESPRKLKDSRSFAADSLFCEWGYVIDLDANKLEVYEGFNTTTPLTPTDRFYGFTEPDVSPEYQPIRKVHEWPLDALPPDDEFEQTLQPPENEDA